jgi:hypothetical protein
MKQDLKNIQESYLSIYYEQDSILVPRRSAEERQKNRIIAINKQIQNYIKNGSKGDLDLSNTPITKLPNGLSVGGSLNLRNTPITKLPDDLSVDGNLNLFNTQITALPDGLKVRGDLGLSYTPIKALPDGLSVGGDLYLYNNSLAKKYTKEQIKQMYPGVKGNIYL